MEEYKGLKVPKINSANLDEVYGKLQNELNENTPYSCLVNTLDSTGKLYNCRQPSIACDECIMNDNHTDTLRQYLAEKEKPEQCYPKDIGQMIVEHEKKGKEIAVHCPDKELWNKVQEKAWGKVVLTKDNEYSDTGCINIHHEGLRHTREWYEEMGYTIISAEEYLGEEKEATGTFRTISGDITIEFDNDGAWEELIPRITLLNTKQEDTMNSIIEKVFEEKTHKEVKIIDRYFGGSIPAGNYGEFVVEQGKDAIFADAMKREKQRLEDVEKKKEKK